MHPGDGDAVLQPHQLSQHLGALNHLNLVRPRLQHLGIIRMNSGTGHHHRGSGHVRGIMSLVDRCAHPGKPVSHRRAAQIGARNLHVQVKQNLGNAAHADAADADKVRVLRGCKHKG